MLNLGLRRLTCALLERDTECDIHYAAPVRLAKSAASLSRAQKREKAVFFSDGAPAFEKQAKGYETLVLDCSAVHAKTLAAITGARLDRNGALAHGGEPPMIALGWESHLVSASDGAICGSEKAWLYKCKARLGSYTRAAATASPKIQAAQLIITAFPTRFLFEGEPLTDTALYSLSDDDEVAKRWFDAVYIPE